MSLSIPGLPDKEIVVSLDILPELKELWPKKGDKLYIRLEVDKKDRIWGLLAYQEDFQRLARPAYNNMQNQKPGQAHCLPPQRYQELLYTYQRITCLVSFTQVSATQSHVWGKC